MMIINRKLDAPFSLCGNDYVVVINQEGNDVLLGVGTRAQVAGILENKEVISAAHARRLA